MSALNSLSNFVNSIADENKFNVHQHKDEKLNLLSPDPPKGIKKHIESDVENKPKSEMKPRPLDYRLVQRNETLILQKLQNCKWIDIPTVIEDNNDEMAH